MMHQQNSVNQKIRDYALKIEKLQHVTMGSMLFNTSKLLREGFLPGHLTGGCSEINGLLEKGAPETSVIMCGLMWLMK